MRRQRQLIRHDPEIGVYGDCWRTCISMILDLPAEVVPNFIDNPKIDSRERARDWLSKRGLTLFEVMFPGENSLEEILRTLSFLSRDVPVIIGGTGPRGHGHAVVSLGGEIWCDPATGHSKRHPETALIGPLHGMWTLEVLSVSAGNLWSSLPDPEAPS